MRKTGRYENLGSLQSFIPDPLPPKNPDFNLDDESVRLYGEVMFWVGKLNEMANRLPDISRFVKAYVIKEALLSSAIEGIHTTLVDVYTQPILDVVPDKDTQLVLNYTEALNSSLDMIKKDGWPISNRVILNAHKVLLANGDGDRANPGAFRKQPVRVGNLVPAPAPLIPELMSELERYINDDAGLPLIKAGLAHVQFETIHPFLDGNGRIGRLLIVLMLIESKILVEPIIYPSYYFKSHQWDYYKYLDLVRTEGDFESWIKYYLKSILMSVKDAFQRSNDIEALEHKILFDLKSINQNKKALDNRSQAVKALFRNPIISINELSIKLDVSYNTANQVLLDFLSNGLVVEINSQKRGKVYSFKPYLDLLEKNYI